MVFGTVGGVGARGVDRGCGEDSGQRCAAAEARQAGCAFIVAVADGAALSADLGSFAEQKDLRQLLIHRYKLVRMRAQVKKRVATPGHESGTAEEKAAVECGGTTSAARDSTEAVGGPAARRPVEDEGELDAKIDLLDEAVAVATEKDERARLLLSQPGVGPITALAFVLTIGDVTRFPRQTGGQLSGADSARVQFRRAAAAGRHQQTGQ